MEEREAKIAAVEEALGNNRKLGKRVVKPSKEVFPMKAPCTLTHLRNGIWLVHHTSPALGTVGVSANAREEALTKMRNELQYRLELCPCSGVSGDTVVLKVMEDFPPAR
jgi:hypothetical protein